MTNFNRNDTFNLFSKLSFRRTWNGIQVLSSYYISKWTAQTNSVGITGIYFIRANDQL